ncbi:MULTISPECIES: hypothetical protein [Streptomyces]|uniref:hypothetical protein n=1 Tax=Streptomyces TaxID=1883 RepID=UPI000CC33AC2|nr:MULTISPECIES: hypothetical protein [Streptomyces]
MYYTELSSAGGHHVVAFRRSADLLHWSEPGVAFTDATTDTTVSVTELLSTGRTHVFAVTAEGRMRTRVQDRPSGGWRPWTAFGDRAVAPVVSGSPAL